MRDRVEAGIPELYFMLSRRASGSLPSSVTVHTINKTLPRRTLALKLRNMLLKAIVGKAGLKKKSQQFWSRKKKKNVHKENSIKVINFSLLKVKNYCTLEYYYITNEFQPTSLFFLLSGFCLGSFHLIMVVLTTVNQWISYIYRFKVEGSGEYEVRYCFTSWKSIWYNNYWF